jgi:hypothetical protein
VEEFEASLPVKKRKETFGRLIIIKIQCKYFIFGALSSVLTKFRQLTQFGLKGCGVLPILVYNILASECGSIQPQAQDYTQKI